MLKALFDPLKRFTSRCRWVDHRLVAYLHGAVPAAERQNIEAHLNRCPACTERLRTDQQVQSQLAAGLAPGPQLSSQARQRIRKQVSETIENGDKMNQTHRLTQTVYQFAALALVVAIVVFAIGTLADRRPPGSALAPALTQTATPLPTRIPGGAGDQPVTITFAVPDVHQVIFQDLAAVFHQQNPNITVEIISADALTASSHLETLNRLAAGADSSFSFLDSSNIPPGLFLDLVPWVEADASFQAEDFFPGVLDAFRRDGQLQALPSHLINLNFVLVDRDLLVQAGQALPQPNWSREEFLALAQALTRRSGDQVTQYGFVDFTGAGMDILVFERAHQALAQGRLDAPEVVEALRWYAELDILHHVMPPMTSGVDPHERDRNLVAAGQAAMWTDTLYNYYVYMQNGRSLALLPLPSDDGSAIPASMAVYSISAQAQNPEAAWQWIHFLDHQVIPTKTADSQVLDLPARRSAASQMQYWDSFNAEVQPVLRDAVERLSLSMFRFVPLRWRVENAAAEVRLNGKPVEAALSEALAGYQQEQAALAVATPTPLPTATPLPPPDAPGAGPVLITFAAPEEYHQEFQELATGFNLIYPDIMVEIVSTAALIGTDSLEVVPRLAAGADSGFYSLEPYFIPPGHLLDLTPLMQSEPYFQPEDFFPGTLEAYRQNEQLLAMPAQAYLNFVLVDLDLLEQAGQALPQLNWSREEFLALAQALTIRSGDQITQYGFVDFSGSGMEILVFEQARQPLAQGRLDSPQVAEALRWYTDLDTLHHVMPPMTSGANLFERDRQLVDAGQAAMWTDSLDRYRYYTQNGRNLALLPLPSAGRPAVPASLSGYFISAQTPHAQAAWQWIYFLTHQIIPHSISGQPLELPARRSVAEGRLYWEAFDDHTQSVLRDAAERLSVAGFDFLPQRTHLYDAAAEIRLNNQPVEAALSKAQVAYQQVLALQAAATPTPVPTATPLPVNTPAGGIPAP